MTTALFIATIVCIVANAGIAAADFARAEFVRANSAEVHVPPRFLPHLATMKAAGTAGLVAGLVIQPWIGVAAGAGLTVFFIGAVVAHVRARVLYNIAFPGAFLLLAVVATVYLARLSTGA